MPKGRPRRWRGLARRNNPVTLDLVERVARRQGQLAQVANAICNLWSAPGSAGVTPARQTHRGRGWRDGRGFRGGRRAGL